MKHNKIYLGDCLEVLGQFPDNSIDTVIADPPYSLGKEFDIVEVLTHWLNGDDYKEWGAGFMNKDWDIMPGPSVWKEVYRVMKPGGMCLVFGGTRTHDLTMIALRMAGFQIRDTLTWLYGSGIALGLNISKGIDKAAGAEREVVGVKDDPRYKYSFAGSNNGEAAGHKYGEFKGIKGEDVGAIAAPATDAAKQWDGWNTRLKPSWEPIILAMVPVEKNFVHNALTHGVAGLNVDGARIGTKDNLGRVSRGIRSLHKKVYQQGARPRVYYEEHESKLRDYSKGKGRFPANTLLSHHPDCVRRGVKRVSVNDREHDRNNKHPGRATYGEKTEHVTRGYADPDGKETVADWQCVEDCAVRMLGEQSGILKTGARKPTGNQIYGGDSFNMSSTKNYTSHEANQGTAARFFYCAKSSRSERGLGCENLYWKIDKNSSTGFTKVTRKEYNKLDKKKRARGNIHPTVKPLSIVEYLCKLTKTPTGGIVLDPFGGSGTLPLAAIRAGRDWIMIEKESDYVRIAKARIRAIAKYEDEVVEDEEQMGQVKLF